MHWSIQDKIHIFLTWWNVLFKVTVNTVPGSTYRRWNMQWLNTIKYIDYRFWYTLGQVATRPIATPKIFQWEKRISQMTFSKWTQSMPKKLTLDILMENEASALTQVEKWVTRIQRSFFCCSNCITHTKQHFSEYCQILRSAFGRVNCVDYLRNVFY